MSQHTPGPWHLVQFDDESVSIIIGPSGDDRICEMHSNTEPESEKDANARLIASAPDLLAALKDERDALQVWMHAKHHIPDDIFSGMEISFDKLDRAIRRAEEGG